MSTELRKACTYDQRMSLRLQVKCKAYCHNDNMSNEKSCRKCLLHFQFSSTIRALIINKSMQHSWGAILQPEVFNPSCHDKSNTKLLSITVCRVAHDVKRLCFPIVAKWTNLLSVLIHIKWQLGMSRFESCF